jgi:hypothetical protein
LGSHPAASRSKGAARAVGLAKGELAEAAAEARGDHHAHGALGARVVIEHVGERGHRELAVLPEADHRIDWVFSARSVGSDVEGDGVGRARERGRERA